MGSLPLEKELAVANQAVPKAQEALKEARSVAETADARADALQAALDKRGDRIRRLQSQLARLRVDKRLEALLGLLTPVGVVALLAMGRSRV